MLLLNGETMASYWRVLVATEVPPPEAAALNTHILRILARINALMSNFIPDSEIERLSAAQGTEPLPLSFETREVLSLALEICAETEGLYDITIAPLVNLWGFGPEKNTPRPDAQALSQARAAVDYRSLELSPAGLRKKNPAARLNLCSIAKGYAVDRIGALLEVLGYRDYLVEIGGETRILGHKPGGEPWRIGIERPVPGGSSEVVRVLAVKDLALSLATSGNYKNYREDAAHELDPRSGHTPRSTLASASVLAACCAEADAYATALMLMGEAAPAFAEQHHLAALLLFFDATQPHGLRVVTTPALIQLLGAI